MCMINPPSRNGNGSEGVVREWSDEHIVRDILYFKFSRARRARNVLSAPRTAGCFIGIFREIFHFPKLLQFGSVIEH